VAWTAIVAMLALASSVVGLVFDLRPELKRDPRTQVGADVAIFAVDQGVSFGQFVEDRTFTPTDVPKRLRAVCPDKPPCPEVLNIPGIRMYVTTSIRGFKSRAVSLRLSLYDAVTRTRLQGASNTFADEEVPNSPSAQSVVPVWLPCPTPETRRYFVRVELYHRADDSLLAVGDSKRFLPRC
jgi:hypothetical protein